MEHANSIEEWMAVAAQHERVAQLTIHDPIARAQAFQACGFAVECLLKATIFKVERMNAWPSRQTRRDVYTHDLRKLLKIAGIQLDEADPRAPSWLVVLQWDRNQGYAPRPMPAKVADDMLEATFGPEGVATWLRQNLT